jgi:CubicO group peptidase (beta-lactamase class C family)
MASDPARFIARVRDAELRAELSAVAERARTTPELEYPPLLWIRLAAWQPLRFEPGTDTHYSNIGFDVLGLIAKRASGASIAELYDSLLIRPLGLVSTAYDPQGPIAGRHARGYRIAATGTAAPAPASAPRRSSAATAHASPCSCSTAAATTPPTGALRARFASSTARRDRAPAAGLLKASYAHSRNEVQRWR